MQLTAMASPYSRIRGAEQWWKPPLARRSSATSPKPGLRKSRLRSALACALWFAGAAVAAPAYVQVAVAEISAVPSRPLRIIVPAAPGGTLDIIARTLSPSLADG